MPAHTLRWLLSCSNNSISVNRFGSLSKTGRYNSYTGNCSAHDTPDTSGRWSHVYSRCSALYHSIPGNTRSYSTPTCCSYFPLHRRSAFYSQVLIWESGNRIRRKNQPDRPKNISQPKSTHAVLPGNARAARGSANVSRCRDFGSADGTLPVRKEQR